MRMSFRRWKNEGLDKYWNDIAKEMNFGFQQAPSTEVYKRSEIELFKTYFKDIKGKKLLKLDLWNEVNNTGILFWAAEKGAKIYGLDISGFIVREAKKNFMRRNKKAALVESDIRNIKFLDNSFDFIYTMGTIEHVPDYRKAIKEIYRVLKPGGTAIIGVPNLYDPFLRPLTVWLLERFNLYPYSPEKAFSMTELTKDVENAGFKLVDKTGILFMPGFMRMLDIYAYKTFKWSKSIFKLFFKPFEFLERKSKFFKRRGYLIAIIVEK